jgi:hypothetical protein
VAGDRDLLAVTHCVQQGGEVGFGLKCANGPHGGASTSCQLV